MPQAQASDAIDALVNHSFDDGLCHPRTRRSAGLGAHMLSGVRDWSGTEEQADDITLVLARMG